MHKTMIDKKELRQFGWIMAVMLSVVFGGLVPWLRAAPFPIWPWLVSAGFALAALTYPAFLRPVHRAWMKFGHVLGWINSRIILAVFFFAMVAPIGLIMRLFGNDPMARRWDKRLTSYRVPSHARTPQDLEKPF